ncbi:DUF5320 domain-containing protein [Clostridium frigoris]|uniref:DUF5320 domain-containing protein n=1 Tax=Clostridium frigoris TaxID=205327 RepID=A0ABS6BUX7_9CLOT|nr:DUF5320 domain-containing protein [Clostridium frigoris]MBU3160721.1 DUF5320 domain-containing protein [Clostridium frigoris]
MARRDGTGPRGMGSNTGRGMGGCNVTNAAGETSGLGMGLGLGRRGGCGMGLVMNGFNNSINPVNQKDLLAQEKINLENRLNLINNQLNTSQGDK